MICPTTLSYKYNVHHKRTQTLFSDKSDPKSCQESLTASRRWQPSFHPAIHYYNCPHLSPILMQLMLRYNYRKKSLHEKSVLSSRCCTLNVVEKKTLAFLLKAFSFPLCDGKLVIKYTLDGREQVRMLLI